MQSRRDYLLSLDEQQVLSLYHADPDASCALTLELLAALKVACERVEQNSGNSSTPSGSLPPWASAAGEASDEDDKFKVESGEAITTAAGAASVLAPMAL